MRDPWGIGSFNGGVGQPNIKQIVRYFVGFLMHFRPFPVKKKKSDFSDFFPISPLFQIFSAIFFDDLLNIGLLPPPPLKPSTPHGSPIVVFYKKYGKNRISDADPQKRISDSYLHPKNMYLKKYLFLNVLLPKFYQII